MSDKSPIYPVEVIEVACRALAIEKWDFPDEADRAAAEDLVSTALRIIRDGLASHEKAIKRES